jgi:hypothetical protein
MAYSAGTGTDAVVGDDDGCTVCKCRFVEDSLCVFVWMVSRIIRWRHGWEARGRRLQS